MPFQWPPRPESKISKDALAVFEKLGHIAQVKKNGTCTVLSYNATTQELQTWTRHNEPHKLWTADLNSPCLRRLKELKGGTYQLVGELLHSKVMGIRDTLYLFDILVLDDLSMVGVSYEDRLQVLHDLWDRTTHTEQFDLVDERLLVANSFTKGFGTEFAKLTAPEDEGLVLKDPKAPLEPCWRQTSNTGWQVKCRRPTKNFGF